MLCHFRKLKQNPEENNLLSAKLCLTSLLVEGGERSCLESLKGVEKPDGAGVRAVNEVLRELAWYYR